MAGWAAGCVHSICSSFRISCDHSRFRPSNSRAPAPSLGFTGHDTCHPPAQVILRKQHPVNLIRKISLSSCWNQRIVAAWKPVARELPVTSINAFPADQLSDFFHLPRAALVRPDHRRIQRRFPWSNENSSVHLPADPDPHDGFLCT